MNNMKKGLQKTMARMAEESAIKNSRYVCRFILHQPQVPQKLIDRQK